MRFLFSYSGSNFSTECLHEPESLVSQLVFNVESLRSFKFCAILANL